MNKDTDSGGKPRHRFAATLFVVWKLSKVHTYRDMLGVFVFSSQAQ
jgi:hypothetical protein